MPMALEGTLFLASSYSNDSVWGLVGMHDLSLLLPRDNTYNGHGAADLDGVHLHLMTLLLHLQALLLHPQALLLCVHLVLVEGHLQHAVHHATISPRALGHLQPISI